MKFVTKALVMNSAGMDRALSRLASEIVERNGGAENVVLLGVRRRGIPLARRMAKRIAEQEGVSPREATIDVAFYNDDLSMVAPTPVVSASSLDGGLENATLVIVDDVLYTGRTVWAAVQYLLANHPARRIQLAVLVDRGHHVLPIHADYVGCVLPTRSDEVVKVMLEEFDAEEQVLIVRVESGAEAAIVMDSSVRTKDLLWIRGMSPGEIVSILDEAEQWKSPSSTSDRLSGRTVINLFLEPSTRTRVSFEIAAKRLGANVVNIAATSSSLVKGESLVDTARTLDAMQPDAIVIRHPSSGAPRIVALNTSAAVINGGDGAHEHPTQALLDALTIRGHKGRLNGLRAAIVGDILHSRVARSNAHLLTTLGSDVVLCGPRSLLPEAMESIVEDSAGSLSATTSIDEALEGADVVMMLRVQHERQQESFVPSISEYTSRFRLNVERLGRAKPDAIVMHPGPVNRGVEMTPEVADGPHSVILEQVANGVAVRMAVLDRLIGNEIDHR